MSPDDVVIPWIALASSRSKILDKSKLVLNNPINSRHTKLDKSKLVLNNPVMLCHRKLRQVQTCFKLLFYNMPISHHGEIHQTNTRQV